MAVFLLKIMANKLFSQGSIIYFQLDGAAFPQNDLCDRVVVVQVSNGDDPVFRIKSPMIGEHDILLSALTTKDGTAYTKATLTSWIGSNLGPNGGLDPSNRDAFNRERVSELTTLIDIKQLWETPALFIDIEEIGTGSTTYNSGDASTTIEVAANNDKVVHQTKQRFNYQSGKSLQSLQTCYGFQPEAGVTKRIGYFSSSTTTPFSATLDGWFLESTETGITLNIYKSGTPTLDALKQEDWNGDDISDVDWSKNQIIFCDLEWLGVGLIRFGLVRSGKITYFHQQRNDNVLAGVYMSSPNQPLRWEITSTGGAGTFTYVCSTVSIEGSQNQIGVVLSENNGPTDVIACAVAGTTYALLGIRLRSGRENAIIDILKQSVLATTNDDFLVEIYLNPTVAGTFTYNDIANSAVAVAKADPAGSNTVTINANTVLLPSFYGKANDTASDEFASAIRLGSKIDGTPDEIVLCVTPRTINLDALGAITFRQLT